MMLQELKEISSETMYYFSKSIEFVKPIWVFIVTIVSYVLFPTDTYVPATIALLCTLGLDILTKYIAVSVNNGGLYNAIKTRKLTSDSLWRGTRKKLIGVLIVLILCGLSYRITPFSTIPSVIQSICFTVLFLRESQSVIENLIEAGYDNLSWLLTVMKKKEKEVLNDDSNIVNPQPEQSNSESNSESNSNDITI